MADLVAQGPQPEQTWRKTLPTRPVTLGREQLCEWATPWDEQISRLHVTLTWQDGKLQVQRHPHARNPLFCNGIKVDQNTLGVGESFVIGRTRFTVAESELATPSELPSPVGELTCSAEELREVRYGDAAGRIEALSKLPGVIRFSPTEEELQRQVLEVLLAGIPQADGAAIVRLDARTPAEDTPIVQAEIQRPGRAAAYRPSRRLVRDAIRRRRQPVLHRWFAGQPTDFTVSADFDWALCVPLPDDPEPGWALYVVGRSTPGFVTTDAEVQTRQKEDLKFAGLVADLFGALRQVRDLERRKSVLESFLSPTVLAALAYQDMDEILKPRQTDVTVLFCDLRGFSRLSEADEKLETLCDRVNEALGVMTRNILDKEGVISDFQGDAAMGFWGWPLKGDDQVAQAARAALAIRKEFSQFSRRHDHPLANFKCGIGLAHGPAIAGRLGTLDQGKVGVFGPVVNLASRLEGMTKRFGVSVLIDERVAERLQAESAGKFRVRRLARVQPQGMARQVLVHELMVPRHEPGTLPERDQRDFEAGLEHFLEGRWSEAQPLFELLPTDEPSQVLLRHIQSCRGKPPPDWAGVLRMESK